MIRTLFKDERKVFRQMLLAVRAEAARTQIVILLYVPTLNLKNNLPCTFPTHVILGALRDWLKSIKVWNGFWVGSLVGGSSFEQSCGGEGKLTVNMTFPPRLCPLHWEWLCKTALREVTFPRFFTEFRYCLDWEDNLCWKLSSVRPCKFKD